MSAPEVISSSFEADFKSDVRFCVEESTCVFSLDSFRRQNTIFHIRMEHSSELLCHLCVKICCSHGNLFVLICEDERLGKEVVQFWTPPA